MQQVLLGAGAPLHHLPQLNGHTSTQPSSIDERASFAATTAA